MKQFFFWLKLVDFIEVVLCEVLTDFCSDQTLNFLRTIFLTVKNAILVLLLFVYFVYQCFFVFFSKNSLILNVFDFLTVYVLCESWTENQLKWIGKVGAFGEVREFFKNITYCSSHPWRSFLRKEVFSLVVLLPVIDCSKHKDGKSR